MALSITDAKSRIDAIFDSYRAVTDSPRSVLSAGLKEGKLYEAWVLGVVLEKLRIEERFSVTLVNSRKVHLKAAPGPINPSYPHFVLEREGESFDVWTDVEFLTLSHRARNQIGERPGDYHELDIMIVPSGQSGRPYYDKIAMGIECKNSAFLKHMARAALGVRRELSLLTRLEPTVFRSWPRSSVPASPPSVYMVYSTDPKVELYSEAGEVFGVNFSHEPMK